MRNPLAPALIAACLVVSPVPAGAEELGKMIEAERDTFNEAVRSYLLTHPEVMIEVMNELQASEEREAATRDLEMLAANSDAIFHDANDWSGGNPDGDITVVELMDYRCPYCYQAYKAVDELVETDGNIRFVLKEFPVLGDKSVLASKFAISVLQIEGSDAYKAIHDALFEMKGEVDEATLRKLVTDKGYDADAIFKTMESDEVQKVIDANYALAQTLEINGTPTFIINNAMVRGYVPLDGMRKIVGTQRDRQ